MIKRVVITGATSSIGTALCSECIKQGKEVLAIVQPNSKNISRIPKHNLISIVERSLQNYNSEGNDSLSEITDNQAEYDAFIHLAWASTQGDAARGKITPQIKNIEYAIDAVELADRLGCKVFIGAGSQAEYGRTEETLAEETVCRPETPYGMAKLCAGQMTRFACKEKGIRHIWPRILSGYGPNCQPQTVLNYTITELLKGNVPKLSGGDQIWDFIYTGDIARALLLLAEFGKDGETYVLGSGHSRPLKEYLEITKNIVNPNVELGLGEKPYSKSTVMHLSCNIDKIKRDTGFEPEISFEEGIRLTRDWIAEQME